MTRANEHAKWEDSKAYDCLKLVTHVEAINRHHQGFPHLDVVFAGHVGIEFWRLAIIEAAKNEGGSYAVSNMEQDTENDCVCRDSGAAEPLITLQIMILAQEPLKKDEQEIQIVRMMSTSHDEEKKVFVFGRTHFQVEFCSIEKGAPPATRLALPSSFALVHKTRTVLVQDPPSILINVATELKELHDELPTKSHTAAEKLLEKAWTIWAPLLILYRLYRLFETPRRSEWSQAPFQKQLAEYSMRHLVRTSVQQKLCKRLDDIARSAEATEELVQQRETFKGEHQRLADVYQELGKALRYFASVLSYGSSHNDIHYPSYPRKPHEPATRPRPDPPRPRTDSIHPRPPEALTTLSDMLF